MSGPFPLPASKVIPQTGPMRSIDALHDWQHGRAAAGLQVRKNSPFVDEDGRMAGVGLIEAMAQTAAAAQSCEALLAGRPRRVGYLVGLRNVYLGGQARLGDALTIETERIFQMDEAVMIDGSVRRGREEVARGTLKVWEMDSYPDRPNEAEPSQTREDSPDREAPPDPRGDVGAPMRRQIREAFVGWEGSGEEAASAEAVFPPGFVGFAGHFDGFPLLPAVAMVQTGALATEFLAGEALRLAEVSQAKFSRLVLPGEALAVSVSWNASKREASVRLACGDEATARMTLRLDVIERGGG